MISVAKDDLVFMVEISCMDDFAEKSPSVEELSAKCDQQQPDFAHTEPFTWSIGPQ